MPARNQRLESESPERLDTGLGLVYLPEGEPLLTEAWVPGWPACAHNAADADAHAERTASGLYAAGPTVPEPVEPVAAAEPEPEPAAPRAAGWWRVHGVDTDEPATPAAEASQEVG